MPLPDTPVPYWPVLYGPAALDTLHAGQAGTLTAKAEAALDQPEPEPEAD